jgi:hypothetical protein
VEILLKGSCCADAHTSQQIHVHSPSMYILHPIYESGIQMILVLRIGWPNAKAMYPDGRIKFLEDAIVMENNISWEVKWDCRFLNMCR